MDMQKIVVFDHILIASQRSKPPASSQIVTSEHEISVKHVFNKVD